MSADQTGPGDTRDALAEEARRGRLWQHLRDRCAAAETALAQERADHTAALAQAKAEGGQEAAARVEVVLDSTEWDGWEGERRLLDRVRVALPPDAGAAHDRRVRAQVLRKLADDIEDGHIDHEDLRQAGVSDLAPKGWSDKSTIAAHEAGSVWADLIRARACDEEAGR